MYFWLFYFIGLGNSSVREYQRNRIYKSTFVAIEWSNIRVKMDFGDKDKYNILIYFNNDSIIINQTF